MSLIRGDAGAPESLPGFVNSLAAAARQVGSPAMIWFAGLAYQMVVIGPGFGTVVLSRLDPGQRIGKAARSNDALDFLPGVEGMLRSLIDRGPTGVLIAIPAVFALFRLAGGLAAVASLEGWRKAIRGDRPPALGSAMHAGRGITRSGLGLYLLFGVMVLTATLIFMGPPTVVLKQLDEKHGLAFAIEVFQKLATGVLAVYGFLLTVLFQLALHSLAQNRRGVGSALLHSWRIARNDPFATARATMVDLVVYLTIWVMVAPFELWVVKSQVPDVVRMVLIAALIGFGGCVRCAFWARAYQILGGPSTWSDEESVGSVDPVEETT